MSSFLELKSSANNWNTDNEEILIRKLKEFTDGYASRTKEILTSINDLESNIIKVETCYYNSLNNLKTMSIKKFVEHSVGSDDTKFQNKSDERKPVQFKSKEEKEQNLINNYKKALSISLDRLNIKDLIEVKQTKDDLIDDNVSMSSSTILNGLKGGNKAGIRLPYIIGQEGFFKHAYCGIPVDEIIEKSERTDTMKSNAFQDLNKNNDNNTNQNGNQIITDTNNLKNNDYDSATLNIMLTNTGNYEKEVYNSDMDKSNLNFNFDANSMYTKVTKNMSKEEFVKQNIEKNNQNIPPVTLVCKEIPKLRNSTLKEPKIVENKGSNIPNIPKINIPIPKIKPKDNNIVNDIKINEQVKENKPEKLDFRTELLRKLNAKGNQDLENNESKDNTNINTNTNNNLNSNSNFQPIKNPSNLSNTTIHRNSISNIKNNNEIRKTIEKANNDDDDEEISGGNLFSNVIISGRQKTNTIFVRPNNMSNKNNLFSNIKEEDDESEVENKKNATVNENNNSSIISKTNQLNNVEKVENKSNKKLQSKY